MQVYSLALSPSWVWMMSRLCSLRQLGLSRTSPLEHLGTLNRWEHRSEVVWSVASLMFNFHFNCNLSCQLFLSGSVEHFCLRWWNMGLFLLSSPCWHHQCCTSVNRLSGLSETLQVKLYFCNVWIWLWINTTVNTFNWSHFHYEVLGIFKKKKKKKKKKKFALNTHWSHCCCSNATKCDRLTGDGPAYRDVLIECNVIPALLSRISPDTPVSENCTRLVPSTRQGLSTQTTFTPDIRVCHL